MGSPAKQGLRKPRYSLVINYAARPQSICSNQTDNFDDDREMFGCEQTNSEINDTISVLPSIKLRTKLTTHASEHARRTDIRRLL